MKVIIRTVTGKQFEEKEYEYDKNLDKMIATIDTMYLIRQGTNIEAVMADVSNMLAGFIENDVQLLVLPEFIKVEFIKLEKIDKEEKEDGK